MVEVSNITFHYVLKALEAKTKIPINEMLGHVGLSDVCLTQPGGKIESEHLSTIFRYCMQQTDNAHLALDIGASIPYQSLGILGYLLLNTTTLKQMIEKFDHYQKLISAHLKFNLYDEGDYYKIAILINENPYIPVPSFHAEVHLSAILNILSQLLGRRVVPDYTHFSQDEVGAMKRYREVFGEAIFFNREVNAVFFKKDGLDIAVESADPAMLAYFEAQAQKVLHESDGIGWYRNVEREILKNIGDREISIAFVAQTLDVSVRTLQNHLASEGKRFSHALQNVRKRLAQHYILHTRLDDTTIAFLLGYSEVSSFYRAYKKWHGYTPKQCRRRFAAAKPPHGG